MSRRKAAPKRHILPDPLFKSEMLAKFINSVMRSGKKSVAEAIVYNALADVVTRLDKIKPSDEDGDSGKGGDSAPALTKKSVGKDSDIRVSGEAREDALNAFKVALENVMPVVEVRSRRVGGSTYQVPVEIRASRRVALGMRWLVDFSKARNEKSMSQRLANEIVDAIEGRGGALKKREDVHRMAKANQAFAHYRW